MVGWGEVNFTRFLGTKQQTARCKEPNQGHALDEPPAFVLQAKLPEHALGNLSVLPSDVSASSYISMIHILAKLTCLLVLVGTYILNNQPTKVHSRIGPCY